MSGDAVQAGYASPFAVAVTSGTALDMLISTANLTICHVYGGVEHPYAPGLVILLGIRVLDRVLVVLGGTVAEGRLHIPGLASRMALIYLDAVVVGTVSYLGVLPSVYITATARLMIFPAFLICFLSAKLLRHLVLV